MTVPIDITDAKIVKAYAHPLRIRILDLLDERVASPSELASELETPLSNTAYHVRQLAGRTIPPRRVSCTTRAPTRSLSAKGLRERGFRLRSTPGRSRARWRAGS